MLLRQAVSQLRILNRRRRGTGNRPGGTRPDPGRDRSGIEPRQKERRQRFFTFFVKTRTTKNGFFRRPRLRQFEQEALLALQLRRRLQTPAPPRRIVKQRVFAMILREVAFGESADEHHRQLPLPGFEDIQNMHHVVDPVGNAQGFERQRDIGLLPELRQTDSSATLQGLRGLIQYRVECIQSRRRRAPRTKIPTVHAIRDLGRRQQPT